MEGSKRGGGKYKAAAVHTELVQNGPYMDEEGFVGGTGR